MPTYICACGYFLFPSHWWPTGTAAHLEVVVGDVVVVGLHLAERLLVVLHEVVDVKVFSLFDLVNVHLLVSSTETSQEAHAHTHGR